jgi:phosphatidylglycerophosphate synthase
MRKLTAPDALSLFRILAAPACAWYLLQDQWLPACILVALAILSDLLDGPLARRMGTASAAGGLLDHSCDAIFVSCTLAALAAKGYLPMLLPLLVILSFAQYVLDSRALSGQNLRSSLIGRGNGIAYFLLLGACTFPWLLAPDLVPLTWLHGAAWVLVASTLVSMLDRLWTLSRLRRRS